MGDLVPVDANSTSCLLLIILLAWTVYYLFSKSRAHGPNYPPGPRHLPIIGNLLDLAKLHGSTGYQRLAKEFGDIVFLSSFGKNILVVNSSKTAHELFEKRSSTYSCRPQSVMSHELIGWDFSFAHMPYGERWNVHRRMFHREFQQSAATAYQPVQAEEAHALLRNLLQNPENWESYLRHNAAAIIMSVTYGLKVAPTDDMYVSLAEMALEGVGMAASPSGFLVDFFPFLKHVPDWIPGASFRKKAREWHAATIGMKDIPFKAVLEELKMGKAAPSFVSNLLNEQEPEKNGEVEIIKNCAAVIYAAAAESTVSTLASFILAMLTHPEVQEKAQAELDAVIGSGRLPGFEDRAYLPYINALVSEVFRWNPVAPLGLPHLTTADDEYNGYYIPRGTIVVGNTWGILNDPNLYPNPRRFDPERHISNRKPDDGQGPMVDHLSPISPLSSAFGYGRRICPGRFMGDAQVWISIACILSVFQIAPAIDEHGKAIPVTPEFSQTGFICHPLPFRVSFKPRGETAKMLIEQTE